MGRRGSWPISVINIETWRRSKEQIEVRHSSFQATLAIESAVSRLSKPLQLAATTLVIFFDTLEKGMPF